MKISKLYIDRFFKYVHKTDTCWLWTGAKIPKGYGTFSIDKTYLAHRISAYIHNIPDPLNKPFVLHSCDNRSCVNPKHLRWGTPKENTQDMMNRNRSTLGKPATHIRHLTQKQAEQIRLEHVPYRNTRIMLAQKYNVTLPVIKCILENRTYKS